MIITSGSQQALDLFAKIFLDAGDTVIVENPSYLGAIQAFDAYEPRFLAIETDAHGMVPEALEFALGAERQTPKFLYLTPNYQNPTGVTLGIERRKLQRPDFRRRPVRRAQLRSGRRSADYFAGHGCERDL